MAVGAIPVWADLAAGSVNLDADDFAAKITPRTKAVIVQHTFGMPADLDAILPVAQRHGIPVLEDCCHTFASKHRQRVVGTIGAAAFWSYEWGKPIIAGVGGEAGFNDPTLQACAESGYSRDFRPPPRKKSVVIAAQYFMFTLLYGPRRYWLVRRAFHMLGRAGVAQSNYNPVGPGAAMAADFGWQMCGFSRRRLARARHQAMAFLPERVRQAERYIIGLRADAARLPVSPTGAEAVYARLPLFVRQKEILLDAARAANLELAGWYATAVHPLAGDELRLVHYTLGSCPRAEAAASTLVSLPVHPKVTPAFQDRLIAFLNRHGSA